MTGKTPGSRPLEEKPLAKHPAEKKGKKDWGGPVRKEGRGSWGKEKMAHRKGEKQLDR